LRLRTRRRHDEGAAQKRAYMPESHRFPPFLDTAARAAPAARIVTKSSGGRKARRRQPARVAQARPQRAWGAAIGAT
jgi:hypothetical protein